MKIHSLACAFFVLIPLEGFATQPNPYYVTVPQETSSQMRRIAVVSMAARTFHKVGIDKPAVRYEEKDISGWEIDRIYEQQIAAEVQSILGMSVVSAPNSIPDLTPVNANQVDQTDRPDWSAIKDAVLSYCSANSLDAILAISRDNSYLNIKSEFNRQTGTGMYEYGEKTAEMYLIANMALLDCKTGELLAARFIDPPSRRLGDDVSNLGISQWSALQEQKMKADLAAMPGSSWAKALRGIFLSLDQRVELDQAERAYSQIKQTYVEDVPDDKLVTGCRNGINQGLSSAPGSLQPVAYDAAKAKSAIENIDGFLTTAWRQYPQIYQEKKLAKACAKGMVDVLDPPRSALLENDDSPRPAIDPKTGYIGIGIEQKMDTSRIERVFEDTPAERAGLKAGDIIVKVGSMETRGRSLKEITQNVQGKEGTIANLTIRREGVEEPMEFAVMRELFKSQEVKWQTIAPGFAYVRITVFNYSTVAFFVKAIQDLYKQNDGKLKGLVLDLRNNSGGLLTGPVAVSAAFLPTDALVVSAVGREKDSNVRYTVTPDYYNGSYNIDNRNSLKGLPEELKTVPMVILVNKDTASGAEIVPAALQDNKRAKVIGTRTYGMGKIATLTGFSDKVALKLTTAKLYRPNGKAIHELGVTPDKKVEAPKLTTAGFRTKDDVQLIQAVKQLGGEVVSFK